MKFTVIAVLAVSFLIIPKLAFADETMFSEGMAIVLPNVEFKQTSLRTALDELRALSKTSDPQKKGVNIFLKLRNDSKDDISITLTMRSPKLGEVLSSIAQQADLEVIQTPFAIGLIPKSDMAEQGAAANP